MAFIGAKAAVFVAPLALSLLMEPTAYGEFEYALAWAASLSLAAGLGMGGAVPYFLLKRERPEYYLTFRVYMAAVALLGLGGVALAWVLRGPATLVFGIVATAVLTLQGIHSSYLKSRSVPGRASAVESGLYLILVAAIGVSFALRSRPSLPWLSGWVAGWLGVLLALSIGRGIGSTAFSRHRRRFAKIVGFSLPLLLSSLFMGLLANNGRLVAGEFLSFQDVASYGFFYRITAATIVLHQLLTVLFFSRIYTAPPEELDRYFARIAAAVGIAALAVWATGSFLLPRLIGRYREFSDPAPGVFWTLSFQMLFWSGTAQSEFILYREKMAKPLTILLGAALALVLGTCAALRAAGALTLPRMCVVQLLGMAGVLFGELLMLRRAGFRLVRMQTVAAGGLLLFLASLPWVLKAGGR